MNKGGSVGEQTLWEEEKGAHLEKHSWSYKGVSNITEKLYTKL